jgi:gliding motility-associated-like protein
MLNIPAPEVGDWNVAVTSRQAAGDDESGALINTITSKAVVNSLPYSHAGADIADAVMGQGVRFDGSRSYDKDGYISSFVWDFGDGETSSEMEPTHYYSKPGDYSVSLVATETASESNCWAEKTDVLVHVEPEGMLRFPNAFRPDPTGPSGGVVDNRLDNFVFIPYPRNGVKAGTYLLEIFNRYGEKIYESTDVNIGWDGYYRGKLSAQDVYVYKCKCTFENGKIFKEIGNVTLLR